MTPHADVLIVTATAVESRAIIAAVEQHTGLPTRPVPMHDRVYRDLGSIHDRRVFLALSEMGTAGVGACLQTVQKAIAALRPSAVILAGIAFGVDERKQQIGDLLVSRQLLLYEPQRIGKDRVSVRGDRPHASARLIDCFRNAELDWREGPAVTFGLLLSGEKLIDNSDYRALLLQLSAEIVGGEMEGAGLYAACQDAKVDWIVVKAICDFADGNKSVDKDARQETAARNAAAFVAHAVSFLPMGGPANMNSAKPQQTERQLLHECVDTAFASEEDLRTFCSLNFREVARQLRETDRRAHITRELIDYVESRAITSALWTLLQERNSDCAVKYMEITR